MHLQMKLIGCLLLSSLLERIELQQRDFGRGKDEK